MSNSEDEIMIPPKTKRVRHSESEDEDRLSDLPDCVLLHILSFLNAKHAIQTCILSSRWKHLWKRLPTLRLHHSHFSTFRRFTKFVSRVLSLRDGSVALRALDFVGSGSMDPCLLKRIVKYAISHNVQRLGLSVQCDIQHIPPCLFSCQTLTYLKLSVYDTRDYRETLFPKSLNLPALTGLHLGNFAFCADDNGHIEPFSAFNRLNSLVIYGCSVRGALTLCISSATLVNLTVENYSYDFYKIEICTPSLCTFAFTGTPYQKLCWSDFSCVKHVDIDAEMRSYHKEPPLFLLTWLVGLVNVKSLTVSASTIQVLSLLPDLLKIRLASLCNLKSLKVKMKPLCYGLCMALEADKIQKAAKSRKEAARLRKTFKANFSLSPPLPDGIVDFLLQNSPSVKLDFINCSRCILNQDHFKLLSNSEDEVVIPPQTKRVRHGESESEDRLSDLSDCLLLHILSFLNAKHAVRTCILSSRWKHLWKRLPTLILHRSDFSTFKKFTKFVSRVLSLRDASIALHALDFNRSGCMELPLLKRIVKYAISCNVQRLGLTVQCDIENIPPCMFSCQTLTYLKLSLYPKRYGKTLFPKSLNLPALTGLHLGNFAFCGGDNGNRAEPFSAFNKLNSLVISSCGVRVAQTLCISNATLVNLTMYDYTYDFYKIEICTPSLCTFAFTGTPYQELCGSDFSCVKQVDIDAEMLSFHKEPPLFLLTWLVELVNVKSLTVSASTLQVLSLFPDLLKIKLPSLCNLKSLKVKMKPLCYGLCMALEADKIQKAAKSRKEAARLRKAFKANFSLSPPLPDGIVDFLRQNSPSAKLDFINYSR